MPHLAEIIPPLLAWYREVGRPLPWRADASPYHVWISEIMLQQTRIEAAIPYYERFLAAFPTVGDLAAAEDDHLMKMWEGLGYYSRARNLKRAAALIMEQHGGVLPRDVRALRALPGIGDYTSGAIASIAYGLPAPAVDGNVLRVLSRLAADERDILSEKVKREAITALAAVYPDLPEDAAALTQALMELGEVVCIPNGEPLCAECPLASLCEGHRRGVAADLPVRKKKAERRIEERTVLLMLSDGTVALSRRPPSGLLAGMWEFPSLDGHLSPDAIGEHLTERGIAFESIEKAGTAKHVFSHIEWHMKLFFVSLTSPPEGYTLADAAALSDTYALPSAFRTARAKVLPRLGAEVDR